MMEVYSAAPSAKPKSSRGWLDQWMSDPGKFAESPWYKFARDQGLQALERQGAKSGRPMGQEAAQFVTGLAGQQYGDWFDRLTRLSGQDERLRQSGPPLDYGDGQDISQEQRNIWDYHSGQQARRPRGWRMY